LKPLQDLKNILKTKDIILENNSLKDEMNSEATKIQVFQNIFESEELNENSENPFIDEEIYCIKDNISNYDTNNSKEKFIRENFIKKVKNEKKYEKIFLIGKIDKKKKNMGRRKKKKIYRTKSIHNKFNKDNIVRKIKIHFLNAGIKYINEKYREFKILKLKPTKQKFLHKLKQKYTDYTTKKEEKIFLSKKLSEVLSDSVSKRCKNHNIDYNERNIKKLLNKGEPKNLIEFLGKTIEDVYKLYISEGKDKIPEFNLENDLIKIEEDINEKGVNYKMKYKEYALDLISILNEPGKLK
jgi:hypothetical protein